MRLSPLPTVGVSLLAAALAAGPAARVAAAVGAAGNAGQGGKGGYHLFRPTPDSLLRELSTDRPDLTESPYTVDAGRMQLEMDLVGYARDEEAGVRAESWGVAPVNVKLGLTPSADLQIIVESHRRDRVTDLVTGARAEARGFGDITLRLKQNLWGNDGGGTAFALMPFVKIPTADERFGNGSVEGGLIAPLAVSLPAALGLGLMAQVDVLEDGDGEGRHAEWIATGTVGRDLAGPVGAFVEIASTLRPRSEGEWIGTLDAGVTVGIRRDAQLDGGVLLGISRDADDRAVFLGLAIRR